VRKIVAVMAISCLPFVVRTQEPSAPPQAPASVATEPWIAAAVEAGQRGKVPNTKLVHPAGMNSGRVLIGSFSTPFTRVTAAAAAAKRNYKTFTVADVTPDLIAPELHVYALSRPWGLEAARIEAVVITPAKGKDEEKRARAIQPLRLEPTPTAFRSLLGVEFEGEHMLAVFPLSALSEANEVHIVYAVPVPGGPNGDVKGCRDCHDTFSLKDVRVR